MNIQQIGKAFLKQLQITVVIMVLLMIAAWLVGLVCQSLDLPTWWIPTAAGLTYFIASKWIEKPLKQICNW